MLLLDLEALVFGQQILAFKKVDLVLAVTLLFIDGEVLTFFGICLI